MTGTMNCDSVDRTASATPPPPRMLGSEEVKVILRATREHGQVEGDHIILPVYEAMDVTAKQHSISIGGYENPMRESDLVAALNAAQSKLGDSYQVRLIRNTSCITIPFAKSSTVSSLQLDSPPALSANVNSPDRSVVDMDKADHSPYKLDPSGKRHVNFQLKSAASDEKRLEAKRKSASDISIASLSLGHQSPSSTEPVSATLVYDRKDLFNYKDNCWMDVSEENRHRMEVNRLHISQTPETIGNTIGRVFTAHQHSFDRATTTSMASGSGNSGIDDGPCAEGIIRTAPSTLYAKFNPIPILPKKPKSAINQASIPLVDRVPVESSSSSDSDVPVRPGSPMIKSIGYRKAHMSMPSGRDVATSVASSSIPANSCTPQTTVPSDSFAKPEKSQLNGFGGNQFTMTNTTNTSENVQKVAFIDDDSDDGWGPRKKIEVKTEARVVAERVIASIPTPLTNAVSSVCVNECVPLKGSDTPVVSEQVVVKPQLPQEKDNDSEDDGWGPKRSVEPVASPVVAPVPPSAKSTVIEPEHPVEASSLPDEVKIADEVKVPDEVKNPDEVKVPDEVKNPDEVKVPDVKVPSVVKTTVEKEANKNVVTPIHLDEDMVAYLKHRQLAKNVLKTVKSERGRITWADLVGDEKMKEFVLNNMDTFKFVAEDGVYVLHMNDGCDKVMVDGVRLENYASVEDVLDKLSRRIPTQYFLAYPLTFFGNYLLVLEHTATHGEVHEIIRKKVEVDPSIIVVDSHPYYGRLCLVKDGKGKWERALLVMRKETSWMVIGVDSLLGIHETTGCPLIEKEVANTDIYELPDCVNVNDVPTKAVLTKLRALDSIPASFMYLMRTVVQSFAEIPMQEELALSAMVCSVAQMEEDKRAIGVVDMVWLLKEDDVPVLFSEVVFHQDYAEWCCPILEPFPTMYFEFTHPLPARPDPYDMAKQCEKFAVERFAHSHSQNCSFEEVDNQMKEKGKINDEDEMDGMTSDNTTIVPDYSSSASNVHPEQLTDVLVTVLDNPIHHEENVSSDSVVVPTVNSVALEKEVTLKEFVNQFIVNEESALLMRCVLVKAKNMGIGCVDEIDSLIVSTTSSSFSI